MNLKISFAVAVCIMLSYMPAFAGCNSKEALALNMYHEARGDGALAMQIVGEVTLNRVESVNYPDTICDVVYQRGQFSWTTNPKPPSDKESWKVAQQIADNLISGRSVAISQGATHFVNVAVAKKNLKWTKRLKKVARYGHHVFYTDGSTRIAMFSYKPSLGYPGI